MSKFLHFCYYFGCQNRPGHYLFGPDMSSVPHTEQADQMTYLDGKLAPDNNQKQFEAQFWRLFNYPFGEYSAFSWWDRTVDSRRGSNCIIFVPGHIVDQITMESLARKYFPQMADKVSKLTLIPEFKTKSRGTLK